MDVEIRSAKVAMGLVKETPETEKEKEDDKENN